MMAWMTFTQFLYSQISTNGIWAAAMAQICRINQNSSAVPEVEPSMMIHECKTVFP